MAWDGDWKHLAPLCYVCMNDGIGFYIWGLVREVWEGEVLFTAIALAFCEVEICWPPRKCSFTTFFCVFIHFFVVNYIIPSVSFDFLTCMINSLYTDNTRLILSSDTCCQYHFTSDVFFLVFIHNKWPQRGKTIFYILSCHEECSWLLHSFFHFLSSSPFYLSLIPPYQRSCLHKYKGESVTGKVILLVRRKQGPSDGAQILFRFSAFCQKHKPFP